MNINKKLATSFFSLMNNNKGEYSTEKQGWFLYKQTTNGRAYITSNTLEMYEGSSPSWVYEIVCDYETILQLNKMHDVDCRDVIWEYGKGWLEDIESKKIRAIADEDWKSYLRGEAKPLPTDTGQPREHSLRYQEHLDSMQLADTPPIDLSKLDDLDDSAVLIRAELERLNEVHAQCKKVYDEDPEVIRIKEDKSIPSHEKGKHIHDLPSLIAFKKAIKGRDECVDALAYLEQQRTALLRTGHL